MTIKDVISSGTSGMRAQASKAAARADAVANASTAGHKTTDIQMVSSASGVGVTPVQRHYVSSAGSASATTSPTDMMISGDGFFMVADDTGEMLLTRAGNFIHDGETGELKNAAGYSLLAIDIRDGGQAGDAAGAAVPVRITAEEAGSLQVSSDGILSYADANGARHALYQIPVATVPSPDALTPVSGNAYRPGARAGEVTTVLSGADGGGTIRSGYLEGSNGNVTVEMTDLLIARADFIASTKAVQVGVEMLDVILNMKK